jgi:hypothetical protein
MTFRAAVLGLFASTFGVQAQSPQIDNDYLPGLGPLLSEPVVQGIRGGFVIDELSIGSLRGQSRAVELLGQEFSRAASQGLIEAEEMPSQSNTIPTRSLENRANLSVVTGIDRDIAVLTNLPPTTSGAICVPDNEVDLTNWGDPEDRNVLGTLRSAAVAENGNVTPEGAKALARYYIALGFGAEATALTQHIENQEDRRIINAMAEILDKGGSKSKVLDGQVFCQGAVSFWAALARPLTPNEIPTDTGHILNTFSGLPFHLRSHLGPLLAERLRDAGLEEEARNAVNSVTRRGTQTDGSRLVSAQFGLEGTRPDLSRKELLQLSQGTDETAAKALLELLKDAHKRNVPPDPAWVDDVPSLVRATEGTAVASELNIAGLRGLISLSRFDDLRLALNEEGPGITDASRRELAASALTTAAGSATDVVFLRSALGLTKFIQVQDIDRKERLATANRMIGLGLVELASSFLPNAPSSVEERLTASQVSEASGDIEFALTVLGPAASDAPTEIAELLAKSGDTEAALSSFLSGGAEERATRLAMQTGNWEWVESNGLSAVSEAAEALRASPQESSATPQNGLLLEHTQSRRAKAAQLLEQFESDEFLNAFTN